MQYKELLLPYNLWWKDKDTAFENLPSFQRPIFKSIYRSLKEIRQIISITGPRRVGKSTIIKQIIRQLIEEEVNSDDIVYYSMDDPALYRSEIDSDKFFDSLMDEARKGGKKTPTYIFLDEIQRFERWELFLKKYYDLEYPVRFVVSGSASTPIFKKSRESLLGRIKDFHIKPFSFREFLLFQSHDKPSLMQKFNNIHETGDAVMGMLTKHPEYADLPEVYIPEIPIELRGYIDSNLERFFIEGGFPEVWSLPDWDEKQSYLFENQVQKVIMEDLVLAVELRKPEQIKKFFISLLESPGREVNFQKLSMELGISRATIEKYFPLLEMTDLIDHVEKFSKNPIKVRRGNFKCYLVDLALRNAILRIHESLLGDAQVLGLYAENLVFNTLKRRKGTVSVSYYREKQSEVDFIVHLGANQYLPIEVKYRERIKDSELNVIKNFCKRFKGPQGIVVTKRWRDSGMRGSLFYIPLPYFLLLFD